MSGIQSTQVSPLLRPPIASGLIHGSNGALASASTSSTSLVDVVNYTGSGVLTVLAQTDAGFGAAICRLTIDGVIVYENTTGNATGYPVVGNNAGAEGAIPFNSSLRIEHRTINVSYPVTTLYKYRKTA